MAVLTPFGQVLRKLRIDKNLTLKELSASIGNTPAFISAVETGRKSIPDAFVLHVTRAMDLSPSQIQQLRRAADRTRKEIRVEGLSGENRELAAAFARGLDNYSPDQLEKLKKLILKSISGELPFKRTRRGLVVPPQSLKSLRDFAEKVRSAFVTDDTFEFPIIDVLEIKLPSLLDDFYLDIREKEAMGPLEGMVIAGKNTIAIREDVYVGACDGNGRDRFTCCHEFGHFLLHRDVAMARVREDADQVYCDSEWQADTFAGSLMLSHRHAKNFPTQAMASKSCGMTSTAVSVMFSKYQKAGLV
jgi:transcriptional regulator with XRE-family HTH domain